ncbi:MAG: HAMP domain-containing sensor histidine kinase, partial [Bacteroidota bacterium]
EALKNNPEITPEQKNDLLERLDELEAQLKENSQAYQRLQKATQEEIEQMKNLLSDGGFVIQWRLIALLLIIIMVLSVVSYVFYRIARRFRKQRNELAEKNEEIQQQSEEIISQRDALAQQNQKLEELQKSKETLTAMIAHDLRNPLNVIIGYSHPDSLQEHNMDEFPKRAAYIYQASERINVLIDNMLDVQKYARAGLKLHTTTQRPFDTAQKAIDDLHLFTQQKGLDVQNQIDQNLYSDFDFNIIERVFENLLTYAILYSPCGGKITFFSEVGDKPQKVKISVKDTGQGIPKERFLEIFEPFNQLNAKDFAHTQSTGLGLTFCKLALDAHEGSLQVSSEIGQGTTFYFELNQVEVSHDALQESTRTKTTEPESIPELNEEEKKYLAPFI